MSDRNEDARVFVLTPPRQGTSWDVDGAHLPNTDLAPTYGILRRLGVSPPFLKLTIREDGWPVVEDVTEEAVGARLPPPLPFMERPARD